MHIQCMCVVYMSLVYVCVFICLRVRGGCWVSCSITFFIVSLRQGLSTELGITVTASKSQQSPFLLHQYLGYNHVWSCLAFTWIQAHVSCLHGKSFYPLSHLPNLYTYIFQIL